MSRAIFATFLSVMTSIHAINRPVYKIVLVQKGYAQFLQYDVETPPLREFTICTWIRPFDLDNDQSIFTYVTNGNNRVARLWLDSGGRHMNVAINGVVTLNLQVNMVKDVWRHVCLSYQTDYGAWALYIDSRLVTCEASQSLYGFVLPGGGSIIIGYGTADDGAPNGFEGEIFGANMILSSTIERNYTIKVDPQYEQKSFPKNQLRKQNKNNYIVLSDLLTDEVHNTFEKTRITTPRVNSSNSFIKFQTPYSFVEHSVGVNRALKKTQIRDTSNEQEIFDFTISDFRSTKEPGKVDFSKPSQARFITKLQDTKQSQAKLNFNTRNIPMVSEYETPPPPPYSAYFDETFNTGELPITEPYKVKDSPTKNYDIIFRNKPTTELTEIEMPPPLEKNPKFYGQWTSSRFAGTVLNYLKSINFKNSEQFSRKVPHTIPLYKISDSHPYSSDLKTMKVRPPSQFKRRNLVEKQYDIVKRDPQINVQILEDDLRSKIIRMHAETRPKIVEITNRGAPKKPKEQRFYRDAKYEETSAENTNGPERVYYPRLSAQGEGLEKRHNHRYFIQPVHPILKPLQHSAHDSQNMESKTVTDNKDMYTKSLSKANKWHNVKSYSNDYTPRKINMDSEETETKKYPAIRLKYVPEKYKIVEENDLTILNGRKLASTVSDQSTLDQDSISIFKYNHGYLPTLEKNNDTFNAFRIKSPSKLKTDANSFDKHVKIGNALNERTVIGVDEEQKRLSFVGGNEDIPDINRYRSDLDNENGKVPPSLSPRVCKNVELYDRVLYVQPDESIDMSYILSPVKAKNIAIEFVIQNYKKCSLTDSSFQRSEMLLIDWNKTPVRLFGGAYPMTTTDLCGFF